MAPSRLFSHDLEKENIFVVQRKQAADTDTITMMPKKRPLEAEDCNTGVGGGIGAGGLSAKIVGRGGRRRLLHGNGGREGLDTKTGAVTVAAGEVVSHRNEDESRRRVKEKETETEVLDSITVVARRIASDLNSNPNPNPNLNLNLGFTTTTPGTPLQRGYHHESASGTSTGTSTPHVLRNGKPRIVIRYNRHKGKGVEKIEELGVRIGLGATPRLTPNKDGLLDDKESLDGEEDLEAVCVSTLLRRGDFEKMPGLEGAAKRDEKRRVSEPVAGPGMRKVQKGLANGNANSATSSSVSSVANALQISKVLKDDKPLERNIDNVVFGDVTFKAWYPSWYPKEIIGEKALHGEGKGIVVPELYVCKRCFGYGKMLVEWVQHCRCCGKGIPGERIYSHGVGRGGNEATWSIWEVDGGVDSLFCQNLSLFAKLFLDNKSVFYDVQAFNYFLLVHTSPPTSPTPGAQQIVGFFSKEKLSWDNNNLACILIFPPWQRKGLGALLMGISYSIARREEILGGPEKPISELGMKGYKRYWSAEIARWLLEVKESDKKKGKGLVDVLQCSRETWIAPEDCLMVLREMGVVERASKGKGTVERVRVDKEMVRKWVRGMGLGLERVVWEEGFVEGYAVKEVEERQESGG